MLLVVVFDVFFLFLFFSVLIAAFVLSPLFYSNDQLQKLLDETRKTLKHKKKYSLFI